MPRLVFIEGPLRRKEFEIGDEALVTIGRERGNFVVIPDSSVSRRHAVIERSGGELVIRDKGSTNGVYVNGNKVEESRLRPRDRLEFGAAACLYVEDDVGLIDAAELDRVRRAFTARYEVTERLGEGSQASVYLARHCLLHREVALKVLRAGGDVGPAAVDRFVKEARALARLAHPAIVEVFDVGEIEGYTFFALSYLKGGTLDERIKKHGRLSFEAAAQAGIDVGGGLAHAHGRGVIHRDVKPANVLFDEEEHAVLADFGVAKILAETRLTATGSMFGTPLYMSPEQFAGKPATELSDLYSLAATIYKALTGRPPFEGETVYVVGHRIASEEARHPHVLEPSIPVPLSLVVYRALSKDPAARQPSVEAFVHELTLVLEETRHVERAGEPTEVLDSDTFRPRYQLRRKIATGRSSEIYEATREGIGGFAKPVILKKIMPAIANQAQFVAQFARSVEQAATLDHPGISKIFDFGLETGEYFVASEYLVGRPLRELLASSRPGHPALPAPLALLAGKQILGAISYAHASSGVVHGDLRPENVMVTTEGGLKIVDFGLAVPTQGAELVTDDALSGRLPYMPPERVLDQPPSVSSDVYGVGAILYELLAGFPPFRGETRAEILERIVARGPEPFDRIHKSLHPGIWPIVARALLKKPADRWPTANVMLGEVERVLVAMGAPPERELVQFLRDAVRG